MKQQLMIMAIAFLALLPFQAHSHHSFSAFDFSSTIEISGTLTRFDIIQPHVMLGLDVTLENGSVQSWRIESVVPRQWRLRELDPEFAQVGETVTIGGWPAKDGSADMMIKVISGEKGTMMIRDDLGEGAANTGNRQRGERNGEGRSEQRRRAQELDQEKAGN